MSLVYKWVSLPWGNCSVCKKLQKGLSTGQTKRPGQEQAGDLLGGKELQSTQGL